MKPRVSVLIPVWNAQDTLATALDSVRRQTETDWECIVVDDGSCDDSPRIARAFADRDERFRVTRCAHRGIVASLNAGLARCRAAIVARMDADDWMHRDRLARQCEALDRHAEWRAVGCHPRIFPRADMRAGRHRYEAWLHSLVDAESVWRERFVECPVAHPTLAIRREAVASLGYRDRGWPEDYDLVLRLLRAGPCVGMVPQRLLGWRDGPSRLSRRDERYALARFTDCRAWHLSRDFLADRDRYVLWGHGHTGRALRRALSAHRREPRLIVDVHPRRIGKSIGEVPVVAPEDLADEPIGSLVVSVAGPKPRGEIRAMLAGLGYREGIDFVCAA